MMIALALTTSLLAPFQESAGEEAAFPASTPAAEGVSDEALGQLTELVQSFVDDEDIVGGELLVIQNGKSILHEGFGWRDLEGRVPMDTGNVFCVRSMTKPVIGTAVLMLIDDNELEFDDRVSDYLDSFDVEGKRDITIEQLLTHTSGLPMSSILAKDLSSLEGIAAVAGLGAASTLDFEPGTAFQYSDQGSDTLTALVAAVTGASADVFVRERVLDPLGMKHSTCVMTQGHPLRSRALPAYSGSRGAWRRFWGPDDPPLFPFFLGSQGMYSTLEDYARFMDFWRRKGRSKEERLLGMRYARRALSGGPFPMGMPTAFPSARTEYGYQMQLWTREGDEGEDADSELLVFGHTGSDGTHAWVFPGQNAMVLYFTQSRNTLTGLRVEEALGNLFLGGAFDPNAEAPPFDDYLGYYWEGEGDLYRAIIRDGDDMALQILDQGVFALAYAGGDRWKLRANPATVLAFDRSEDGRISGFHIGAHQEFRFEPNPDHPGAAELAALAQKAHRVDRLEELGPVRLVGEIEFQKLGITGSTRTIVAWPGSFRTDYEIDGATERTAFDGDTVRFASTTQPLSELEGEAAALARDDHLLARFGDWNAWYSELQMIQRLERRMDGELEAMYLVRAGDTSWAAPTFYVHGRTGLVYRIDALAFVDGMGRIGQRLTFGDFREVEGMQLPYRTQIVLANPLIGPIHSILREVEVGVEVPAGAFQLAD